MHRNETIALEFLSLILGTIHADFSVADFAKRQVQISGIHGLSSSGNTGFTQPGENPAPYHNAVQ